MFASPARAATGYCSRLFSRGSKKLPRPCISRLATNAFQYVTAAPGARPRMLIDPRQAERRRDQRGGGLAVGTERLAIEGELGVELARPPACEHLANRRLVDAQQVDVGLQGRGERHDGADVQIAVGPAVEPTADAGREGVVDVRMAERALDADGRDPALRIEEPGHAHDRIGLEEGERAAGSSRSTFPALRASTRAAGSAARSTLRPAARACFGETPAPTPPFFSPRSPGGAGARRPRTPRCRTCRCERSLAPRPSAVGHAAPIAVESSSARVPASLGSSRRIDMHAADDERQARDTHNTPGVFHKRCLRRSSWALVAWDRTAG